MWTYKDARWGFEVTFRDGWRERRPGVLGRLIARPDPAQPEFDGPKGAGLKLAIGVIDSVPDVEMMKRTLERLASKNGHWVVDIASITVAGQEHATIVYHVPLSRDQTMRLKNYHVVLGRTEIVATGKIALFAGPIHHLAGRPVQDLQTLYAHNEDYDDIVRTLRLARR